MVMDLKSRKSIIPCKDTNPDRATTHKSTKQIVSRQSNIPVLVNPTDLIGCSVQGVQEGHLVVCIEVRNEGDAPLPVMQNLTSGVRASPAAERNINKNFTHSKASHGG